MKKITRYCLVLIIVTFNSSLSLVATAQTPDAQAPKPQPTTTRQETTTQTPVVPVGLQNTTTTPQEKSAVAQPATSDLKPTPVPTPHPAKGAMMAAIQQFPDLGKKNTAFYLLFQDLLEQRKKTDPASLEQPEWPLDLAQQTAKKLGIQSNTAAPSPTATKPPLGGSTMLDNQPKSKAHHAEPIIGRHGKVVGYKWKTDDQ